MRFTHSIGKPGKERGGKATTGGKTSAGEQPGFIVLEGGTIKPVPAPESVPEPSSLALLAVGVLAWLPIGFERTSAPELSVKLSLGPNINDHLAHRRLKSEDTGIQHQSRQPATTTTAATSIPIGLSRHVFPVSSSA